MDYQVNGEDVEVSDNSKDPTEDISAQKGGFRTIPFILATQSSQMIASIGLLPNMTLYLINDYHMDIATGSSILSLWSALSDYLAILGAFISDSYFGRFRVIASGSLLSVLGLTMLWLTAMIPQAKPAPCNSSHSTCQNPTFAQLALLLSSLGFISIGAGCIKPCSIAFGADQLAKKDDIEKNKKIVDSFLSWFYACTGLSAVIGLTIIVYIQDQWGSKVGFGVPAVLMLLSVSSFLGGSSLYVKMKAQKSLFTGLAQVLVVAFKNRQLVFPPDYSDGFYYHKDDSEFVTPSDKLRFLNKACIIKRPQDDFKYDDSATANPWEVCTVDQVEALKALISVIPIWSTGLMISATILQTSTVVQANIMDRHITSNFQIPAASFGVFAALSLTIWVAFYDQVVIPLMAKHTGRPHGLSPTLRVGIGLLISCLALGLATIVENIRRRIAIQEGLWDDPKSAVTMSAIWLIPQCCLSGIAEAFNAVGQIEYYFAHLPKGMSSLAMAIFTLGTAFAGLLGSIVITIVDTVTKSGGKESWLSNNLNKGHYDYYYALLAFLGLLNFVYFIICCGAYRSKNDVKTSVSNERQDLKQPLLSKSGEFPGTSSG